MTLIRSPAHSSPLSGASVAPDVRRLPALHSLNRALIVLYPLRILGLQFSPQPTLTNTCSYVHKQTEATLVGLYFFFSNEVLHLASSTNKYEHVGMWLSEE